MHLVDSLHLPPSALSSPLTEVRGSDEWVVSAFFQNAGTKSRAELRGESLAAYSVRGSDVSGGLLPPSALYNPLNARLR